MEAENSTPKEPVVEGPADAVVPVATVSSALIVAAANMSDPVPTAQKKIRRRKKKAKEGPKFPHTGYVRYMNVRREQLRLLLPNATNIERTKVIGEEWSAMSDDLKQPYLAAAEIDRERYNEECKSYKQLKLGESNVDAEFAKPTATSLNNSSEKVTKNSSIQSKVTKTETPHSLQTNIESTAQSLATVVAPKKEPFPSGNYDIPIFTDEFLEHNKIVDFELRLLRKSNTDYEQQNSVLEKHVENMAVGVEKLQQETDAIQMRNEALHEYIETLRTKLVSAFGALPIPTQSVGATMDNIDAYMLDFQKLTTLNSHGPASLNKAKDILRKLDV